MATIEDTAPFLSSVYFTKPDGSVCYQAGTRETCKDHTLNLNRRGRYCRQSGT